jgi:hypothetical protein
VINKSPQEHKQFMRLGVPIRFKARGSDNERYKWVSMSDVVTWCNKSVQEYKNTVIVSGIWLTLWVVANLSLVHCLIFFI